MITELTQNTSEQILNLLSKGKPMSITDLRKEINLPGYMIQDIIDGLSFSYPVYETIIRTHRGKKLHFKLLGKEDFK
jgi:predicted transcriptional regulator